MTSPTSLGFPLKANSNPVCSHQSRDFRESNIHGTVEPVVGMGIRNGLFGRCPGRFADALGALPMPWALCRWPGRFADGPGALPMARALTVDRLVRTLAGKVPLAGRRMPEGHAVNCDGVYSIRFRRTNRSGNFSCLLATKT